MKPPQEVHELAAGGWPGALRDKLEAHLEMVLRANADFNLTAVRGETDAWRLHVIDSLMVAGRLADAPGGPLCDIGSGAGYPGIPLGLWSGRPLVLIESRRKKARFLQDVVTRLGLDASVRSQRAEESGGVPIAQVCVARAVSALPTVVELAAPLLEPAGWLLAMKGRLSREEHDAGAAAADVVGMRQLSAERYSLPGGDEIRTLVVYERTGRSSVELPRRAGMAEKRPLG